MTARPFALSLVGAGRMGTKHARALLGHPAIEITTVVEPSDAAMARFEGSARR